MIPKKIALIGFGVLCLIQLYVAGGMVRQNEEIIHTGQVIKLRTAPLDPNDPFRGKYIALDFPDNSIRVEDPTSWRFDEHGYVLFDVDTAGFHVPVQISKSVPINSNLYLEVSVSNIIDLPNEQMVYIEYPFDRFYLEEKKAPKAEEKYREALSDSSIQTYAKIYVQDGNGVIDNVYMGDRMIGDLVE